MVTQGTPPKNKNKQAKETQEVMGVMGFSLNHLHRVSPQKSWTSQGTARPSFRG